MKVLNILFSCLNLLLFEMGLRTNIKQRLKQNFPENKPPKKIQRKEGGVEHFHGPVGNGNCLSPEGISGLD